MIYLAVHAITSSCLNSQSPGAYHNIRPSWDGIVKLRIIKYGTWYYIRRVSQVSPLSPHCP